MIAAGGAQINLNTTAPTSTMEMKAYLASLLTVSAAFAVYLVFAQLAHMKKLKQRDQAKGDGAAPAAPDKDPSSP